MNIFSASLFELFLVYCWLETDKTFSKSVVSDLTFGFRVLHIDFGPSR